MLSKTSERSLWLWSKSQFLNAATGQFETSKLWLNYCKTNYTVSEAFLCAVDWKTEMDGMNIENPLTPA